MVDSAKNPEHEVGLFVTCLVDLFRPQIGFATVELLEMYGCRVIVPVQTCCGQPAYNSGDSAKANVLAKNIIEAFENYDYIVAPSGSCAAMVKLHYPKLFQEDAQWLKRAQRLANKTYELSQFLVDVLGVKPQSVEGVAWNNKKISYHDSCSGLRELGIRSQPRKLLQDSRDIKIEELDNSEICCGFGGTFCVKYPEISTRLADNKIEGADKMGSDVLVGGDLGCLMNLAGRIKRLGKTTQVFHFAEILQAEKPESGIGES